MMRSLYLFVTSERPDQYLNPILHCLLHKNVDKIVFLHIKGLGDSDLSRNTSTKRGISANVFRNVQILLDSLAFAGEYRYFIGKKAGERVKLQDFYSLEQVKDIERFYRRFLNKEVSWSHQDIDYLDLRKVLADIHKKDKESIFDVTAINKSYLGDILAVGIIEGIDNFYTFDLKVSPNFDEPWKMLFHELHRDRLEDSNYQYVNIEDTPIFKSCANSILVRTLPLKISLVVAPLLIALLLITELFYGSANWLIQGFGALSIVASLLSIYYNFFPPRH